IVGILGHNGMGKSTLLKTSMGFLPVDAGSIRYRGTDITRFSPHERARLGIAYVPPGRGIFPQLSVRENLRFAYMDNGQGDEAESVARILTEFPRLERLLDRDGGALSGGEQQLLALARSLMSDPEFLLLDEPTEGIQPSIIEEIAETLLQLRRARGLSILLVEQNFDFIADLSDRVLVLERGRISGELTRAGLLDKAKVDSFLGFGAARSTRAAIPTRTTAASQKPVRPAASGKMPPAPAAAPPLPSFSVITMTVKRPTLSQMRNMADRFGMSLSDEDLREYSEIMDQ